MATEYDIKALWKSQQTEKNPMTLADIHGKAIELQARNRRVMVREIAAALFVIAVFGYYVWVFPGWMIKLGSALTMVWAVFYIWQFSRLAGARAVPPDTGQIVDFHRRELIRRRDMAQGSWRWAMLPLLPGMVLMFLGRWTQFHAPHRPVRFDHLVIVLGTIIAALILVIVLLWQRLRIAKLQQQIDELDALSRE